MATISILDENSIDKSIDNITCKSCNFTVDLTSGSRRTVCPNCGNFYASDAAANISLRINDRPTPSAITIESRPRLAKVI